MIARSATTIPLPLGSKKTFGPSPRFLTKLQQQPGGNLNATLTAMLAGPKNQGQVEIKIPDTKTTVSGRFLGHGSGDFVRPFPREAVADWITSDDNPYFARAAVNRAWAHFFGTGLVDPIDDFDPSNPASHPELLDELARQFVAHGYDHKFLIRAITSSRPYQLTSRFSHPSQRDRRFVCPHGAKAD